MSKLSRCLSAVFQFLFVAALTSGVWAQDWSNKGQTWTHKNGLSVTFPTPYKVTAEKTGALNATTHDGYVILTYTPAKGQAQMKEVMDGILMVMRQTKVSLKADSTTGTQNGVDIAYQEGSCVSNGIPIYVKLGIYHRKEAYLLMQLLVPEQIHDKHKGELESIFKSVR